MYGFWLILLINSVLLGIYMVSNVYKFVKTIINYPPLVFNIHYFIQFSKCVEWISKCFEWFSLCVDKIIWYFIQFSKCVDEGTLPFFLSKFVELYKNNPLYVENLSFRNVFSIFVSNHVKVYSGTFSVPPPLYNISIFICQVKNSYK